MAYAASARGRKDSFVMGWPRARTHAASAETVGTPLITLSVDLESCPACDARLVKLNRSQRKCNTCGFEATLVTEEDERDAEDVKRRYGRDAVLRDGDEKRVGRNATRW